ncbi:Molybdopterin molybdenumtransferase [Candidatus Nitrotoga sp. HW29]|uniref:molybdopterin molybdotransferase MoeA n=1 Tax=Candidatus Nitrotoga sp. HW29 TaxID=2886963 RepID=UPI001EF2631A|nr:gephyrin-like molybdotransferase Glp [Candidatus Nitrotoga sp. HW29]CAH1905457.1 Molybdopterin molybdenumtransferase [Candidatus Nitrotoga sp. HW29]
MESKFSFLSTLETMGDYDPDSMPVEQARQLIQQFLAPLAESESINLSDALHRTLAADILSPMNVPPHNYSAMDGYAVRSDDLTTAPNKLTIIGSAYAGRMFEGHVAASECVRIMTGALIPEGCDSVVMQEHVQITGSSIEIGGGHLRGQNIRLVGEDITQGATVLTRGQIIRPAEMGLLASLGLSDVKVYRKLKVALFSTGDELQQPGTPLAPGQIYNSNRYSLLGMLGELGVEIIDMGTIRDDKASLKTALLDAAARADVIITSGGVSVGEADYIKQLLAEIGEVVFWKIAMKPGRPLAYGKIGTCHFFGLPGNPVAVMVTFQQFVRDALRVLMGQQSKLIIEFQAICLSPIRKVPGRTEFQRGILSQDINGEWIVHTTGAQCSGILSSMSKANCFIVLPVPQGNIEAGSAVRVQPF